MTHARAVQALGPRKLGALDAAPLDLLADAVVEGRELLEGASRQIEPDRRQPDRDIEARRAIGPLLNASSATGRGRTHCSSRTARQSAAPVARPLQRTSSTTRTVTVFRPRLSWMTAEWSAQACDRAEAVHSPHLGLFRHCRFQVGATTSDLDETGVQLVDQKHEGSAHVSGQGERVGADGLSMS